MDRKIVTYGGYFERFMQELTEKEQQKVKYGLLLLKSQDKISTKFVKHMPENEIELAIKIKESYYADKRSSD